MHLLAGRQLTANESCTPDFNNHKLLAEAYQSYFNETVEAPFQANIDYPGGCSQYFKVIALKQQCLIGNTSEIYPDNNVTICYE